jgi:hypothetical protein
MEEAAGEVTIASGSVSAGAGRKSSMVLNLEGLP